MQELLVYRSEVIEGPHMLCLFYGQRYQGSVRQRERGSPNAYDELWLTKWQEAIDFLETTRRKPSKFVPEERNMRSWWKHN